MRNDNRRMSSAMTPEALQELEDFRRKSNVSGYTYRQDFLRKIEERTKVKKEMHKLERSMVKISKKYKGKDDEKYKAILDDHEKSYFQLLDRNSRLIREINGVYMYALEKCKTLTSKRAKKAGFINNESYIDFLKKDSNFVYDIYTDTSLTPYKPFVDPEIKVNPDDYYDPTIIVNETEKHMPKL